MTFAIKARACEPETPRCIDGEQYFFQVLGHKRAATLERRIRHLDTGRPYALQDGGEHPARHVEIRRGDSLLALELEGVTGQHVPIFGKLLAENLEEVLLSVGKRVTWK